MNPVTNPATNPSRGVLSKYPMIRLMLIGIMSLGMIEATAAESVDTELVLLVDVSSSGLKNSEFDEVMAGYASAMSSAQVLDTIESGALGRIAVSMVFYGDDTVQTVGIPWMMIGSAAEAQQFADAAMVAQRPSSGSSSMNTALDAATSAFGSETGSADNGYSSVIQIIEVAGATQPRGGNPAQLEAELQASRDAALAAGVDVINAIAIGKKADQLEVYYSSNVIGGEVEGVVASSTSSAVDGALAISLIDHLDTGIGSGAAGSVVAVPEPNLGLLITLAASISLFRSRIRR